MSSELYNTIYHIILVIYDHTDMISCKVSQWSDPHCEPQAEGRLRRRVFCNSRRTWFLKKECVDTQLIPSPVCVNWKPISVWSSFVCYPKRSKKGQCTQWKGADNGLCFLTLGGPPTDGPLGRCEGGRDEEGRGETKKNTTTVVLCRSARCPDILCFW